MTTYALVYQRYNLTGSLGSKAFYLIKVISLFKMLILFFAENVTNELKLNLFTFKVPEDHLGVVFIFTLLCKF